LIIISNPPIPHLEDSGKGLCPFISPETNGILKLPGSWSLTTDVLCTSKFGIVRAVVPKLVKLSCLELPTGMYVLQNLL